MLKIGVEVSDEVRTNQRTGNRQQVVYVDTGGKYPEEATMFVPDSGPLPKGEYVMTKLRRKGYDIVADLNSLQQVAK